MDATHSDAFVFFGAAGDLAHKKSSPALQVMARRGHPPGDAVFDSRSQGWAYNDLQAT